MRVKEYKNVCYRNRGAYGNEILLDVQYTQNQASVVGEGGCYVLVALD